MQTFLEIILLDLGYVDLHAEMHLALATSANTSNYSVKRYVRKLTGTRRMFSSNFAARRTN